MAGLYESDDWKSLGGVDRAQLLLVIEGLKRGTIISGNWTTLPPILKKAGLAFELSTDQRLLNPVWVIAHPQDLAEYNHALLALPADAPPPEHYRVNGRLLGYPACCVEEYARKSTPQELAALDSRDWHLGYRFGRELDALIKAEGAYPDYFDYAPQTFTPCSVACADAAETLSAGKDALESLDPAAADALVYLNRRGLPQRFVHEEYLRQRREQMHLNDLFDEMRARAALER